MASEHEAALEGLLGFDERIERTRKFLIEKDYNNEPNFIEQLEDIQGNIETFEQLGCDEALLKDVKIKLEVQQRWAHSLRDGPPPSKSLGTYQKLFSTRLVSSNITQTFDGQSQFRADESSSLVTRTEEDVAFQKALRTDSSDEPNSTDPETNLRDVEATAYSQALRNPGGIPRWLHPTLGIPDKALRITDEVPIYRQTFKPIPPPKQYTLATFLRQREMEINELLAFLTKVGEKNILKSEYQRLQELLHPFQPETVKALYQQLEPTNAILNRGEKLTELQRQGRKQLLSQYDPAFTDWIKTLQEYGVQIRVFQPYVPQVDSPGVFYVDRDLEARIDQVKRWEDQLNLAFSKIERQKHLGKAATRRLLEICSVVMPALYQQYGHQVGIYLNGRNEEDLLDGERKEIDRILGSVIRKHVNLAKGADLKPLWRGESEPYPSKSDVTYVPWDDNRRARLDRPVVQTPTFPPPSARSSQGFSDPQAGPLPAHIKDQETRINKLLKQKHLDEVQCSELDYCLLKFWGPLLRETHDLMYKRRIQADIDPDPYEVQTIFNMYRDLGKNLRPFKYMCQRLGFYLKKDRTGVFYGHCGSGKRSDDASPFAELGLYVPPNPSDETEEDALQLQTSINAILMAHSQSADTFAGILEYETSKLFALIGRFLPDEIFQKGMEWQDFQQIIPAISGQSSPTATVFRLEQTLFNVFAKDLKAWLGRLPKAGVQIMLKREGDEDNPDAGNFFIGGDPNPAARRKRSPPYVKVWQDEINALLRRRRQGKGDWWIDTRLRELLQDFMPLDMAYLSRGISEVDHWKNRLNPNWAERPGYYECWSTFNKLYTPWLATFEGRDIRIEFLGDKPNPDPVTPGTLYLRNTWHPTGTQLWGADQLSTGFSELQHDLNQYLRTGHSGAHDPRHLETMLRAMWDQQDGQGVRRMLLDQLGIAEQDVNCEVRIALSLHSHPYYQAWLKNLKLDGVKLIEDTGGNLTAMAASPAKVTGTTTMREAIERSEAQSMIPEGLTVALERVWDLFQKVEGMRTSNIALEKHDREHARRLIAPLTDAQLDLVMEELYTLIEHFQRDPRSFTKKDHEHIQALQEHMWWQLLGNEHPDYRKLLIPETPPLDPFKEKPPRKIRQLPMVSAEEDDYLLLGMPSNSLSTSSISTSSLRGQPPTPRRRGSLRSMSIGELYPNPSQLEETEGELNILLKKYKDGTLTDREYEIFDDLLTYLVPAGSKIEALYKKLIAVKKKLIKEEREPDFMDALLLTELDEEFEAAYTIWREKLPNLAIRLDTFWYDERVLQSIFTRYRYYQAELDKESEQRPSILLDPEVLNAWSCINSLVRQYFREGLSDEADKESLLLSSLPSHLAKVHDLIERVKALQEVLPEVPAEKRARIASQFQRNFSNQVRYFIKEYMNWYMSLPPYFAVTGQKVDFRCKAERRGIKRAALQLALNAVAKNEEQHRPHELFRALEYPEPPMQPRPEVSLALPLAPSKRPLEHDPLKYTKIMQAYNQRRDEAYSKARKEVIALHPHNVPPPANRNGPFTVPTPEMKKDIERNRLNKLLDLASALNSPRLARRPLLKRMTELLREAFHMARPGSKGFEDKPLSQLELDALKMMTELSWNDVKQPYPYVPPVGREKLDQMDMKLFEEDIEALPEGSIPIWTPAKRKYPDHRDLPKDLMQGVYEPRVKSTQGVGVEELLEMLNERKDPSKKWFKWHALKYLPELHRCGRIHLDERISLIPPTGHPENHIVPSYASIEHLPGVHKDSDGTISVQYSADGRRGFPIHQPAKYRFLLDAAHKLGIETAQLREKLKNGTWNDLTADALLKEVLSGAEEIREMMQVDAPDGTVINIALDILKNYPDIVRDEDEVSFELVNEERGLCQRLRIARDTIQLQASIELSNNWEPLFPSDEERSALWAWAAEPRLLQHPRPERFLSLDRRSSGIQSTVPMQPAADMGGNGGARVIQPGSASRRPEFDVDSDEDVDMDLDDDIYSDNRPRIRARGREPKKERHISQNGAKAYMPFPETPFQAVVQSMEISRDMKDVTKEAEAKPSTPSRLPTFVSRLFSPFRSDPPPATAPTAPSLTNPVHDPTNPDATFLFQADTHGYLPASYSQDAEPDLDDEAAPDEEEGGPFPKLGKKMPTLPNLPEGWVPRTVSREYFEQAVGVVRREWGLDPPLVMPPALSGGNEEDEEMNDERISGGETGKRVRFANLDTGSGSTIGGGMGGARSERVRPPTPRKSTIELEVETEKLKRAAMAKMEKRRWDAAKEDGGIGDGEGEVRRSPRKRVKRSG